MKAHSKILAVFCAILIFISFASAYENFLVLKQGKGSDAVIINSVDKTVIKDTYGLTIIKLTKTEGDFLDLINYLTDNQIEKVTMYSHDNIPYMDFGKMLGEEAEVNVDINFIIEGKIFRLVSYDEEPVKPETTDNKTEEGTETIIPIDELTGKIIPENESNFTPIINASPIEMNQSPEINQSITGNVIEDNELQSKNSLLIWLIIGGIILLFIILKSVKKKK